MAKKSEQVEKLVPDTSVIIEGLVSKRLSSKEIVAQSVIVHEAVIAELEHQANTNRSIGFLGLEEIEKLKLLSAKLGFNLEFSGVRPRAAEIRNARLGEIDSMIRELAFEQDGTLFTADKVQALVAQAKNIKTIFVKVQTISKKIRLETFFDSSTMSVHLRENVTPFAKKGFPGKWDFVKITEQALKREEVEKIAMEILEEASIRRDGFVEIERQGSTIVQLGNYRIVITRPPLSDGWEITAVRPVRRLTLDDYKLSEKLKERIAKQAEGILIAGSPGMGKSTFSQALAEFYASSGKIVKTVEAPRDLVLPESVTQYAISHGDAQEIHDILLLSRPDYTIFDEMRNTDDFRLFADLRLAGIGLAGVVHATNPIDAIQRFVGRIELGVIPQVIDTVIFIKDGFINKV
ncbi:Flp pilus assembly complex ATPase component TadA, partial [Candidatus Woesearchaeota archaeon]|nr:Flp pilus assembly complex ATPase component TadA [Candidatus Woesearchaeota archaeon]